MSGVFQTALPMPVYDRFVEQVRDTEMALTEETCKCSSLHRSCLLADTLSSARSSDRQRHVNRTEIGCLTSHQLYYLRTWVAHSQSSHRALVKLGREKISSKFKQAALSAFLAWGNGNATLAESTEVQDDLKEGAELFGAAEILLEADAEGNIRSLIDSRLANKLE